MKLKKQRLISELAYEPFANSVGVLKAMPSLKFTKREFSMVVPSVQVSVLAISSAVEQFTNAMSDMVVPKEFSILKVPLIIVSPETRLFCEKV